MTDWDAAQYLRFEEERTRPSRDLLARIPLTAPSRAVDLGCGPGNSTELIASRYPESEVEGLDSSPDMLAAARTRLPDLRFQEADIAAWAPGRLFDLVFANAVLQWLPDHRSLLGRLMDALAPSGWLAVQMPDNLDEPSHRAMQEVAVDGPWIGELRDAAASRTTLASIETYYDWLASAGFRNVDIWRTTYVHVLDGPEAIVEWVKGTGLRPFLAPLAPPRREEYLAAYLRAVEARYPRQVDGRVLLRFPRLFLVAQAPS